MASRPHTTVGGKMVQARMQRVGQPATAAERSRGAYERVSVRRASRAERKMTSGDLKGVAWN